MKDVVKGGAFAVLAMENSTATDHPTGTCVSDEAVVCAPAAEAEGAATADNQTAAQGDENQTESQGGDEGNNNDEANDEGAN
jgi:hypothetical protein